MKLALGGLLVSTVLGAVVGGVLGGIVFSALVTHALVRR